MANNNDGRLHNVAESLRTRIGRKGAILAILGTAWILNGYGLWAGAVARPVDTQGLFHLSLPTWVRVVLWGGAGLVALSCSLVKPPKLQAIGYGSLLIIPTERALSYLVGWVIDLTTGLGYAHGWAGAALWVGVGGILYVIAGWPEGPHVGKVEETDRASKHRRRMRRGWRGRDSS